MKLEGKSDTKLFGIRNTENGEFIVSSQKQDFTLYGRGYIGTVVPNFLGTKFEVYDYGLDPGYIQSKDLPKDFLPIKKRICTIEYDTNFFAEKPRSFRITIFEE